VLTVLGWVTMLTKWYNNLLLGGFAELDQQILKFRKLNEAYSSKEDSSSADSYRTAHGSGQRINTCTP
jgi:hypothetical protein